DRLMQSSSHSIVSPEEYARAVLARDRAIAPGDRAEPRTQFFLRMMDDAEDPMPRRIGLPALAFKTSGSAVEGRPPQVLRPRGDAVIGRDFDQLAAKKLPPASNAGDRAALATALTGSDTSGLNRARVPGVQYSIQTRGLKRASVAGGQSDGQLA